MLKSAPNAAIFKTIMTSANKYIPIVRPIAICIPRTHISQIIRVFFSQMKTGYPVSIRQIEIPRAGRKYFHLTRISGGIMLKGGRDLADMCSRNAYRDRSYDGDV